MVVNFAAGLVHIKAKINWGGTMLLLFFVLSTGCPFILTFSLSVLCSVLLLSLCFLFDQHMLSTPITKTMQKSSGVELLLLLYLPPTHHCVF